MAIHLLNLILLLVSASALISPNNAPSISSGNMHTKAYFGSSNIPIAFISTSDNSFRNGVSLSMATVGVESEIVASIFAATVGYIMWVESNDISKTKKGIRANKSMETPVIQDVKLASVESGPEEEISEDNKAESHELEPEEGSNKSLLPSEEFVEKDKVESGNTEKSMEPSKDLNGVKESEVFNVDCGEPAGTVELPSTPSSTIEVENNESYTDVAAVNMEKIKQAATESFGDIFDVKKSIASTLEGEKKKVDRLGATSEVVTNTEETETFETEEDVIYVPVSGRKRRIVKKTVKKLLMPWKKWSSL